MFLRSLLANFPPFLGYLKVLNVLRNLNHANFKHSQLLSILVISLFIQNANGDVLCRAQSFQFPEKGMFEEWGGAKKVKLNMQCMDFTSQPVLQ